MILVFLCFIEVSDREQTGVLSDCWTEVAAAALPSDYTIARGGGAIFSGALQRRRGVIQWSVILTGDICPIVALRGGELATHRDHRSPHQ